MSRLTASPFHKPSPFDVGARPIHPLTPPDTDSEFASQANMASGSGLVQAALPMEFDNGFVQYSAPEAPMMHPPLPRLTPMQPAPASDTDSPGARFRKVSTLAYRSSGLREPRERSRSSKSFVVVIPPTSVSQGHAQFGHTLSSGPSHRLSHGILMPLFPTMYGQLSAIAREFNFPSTSGICVYLHVTEGGMTMTPRVSDETWQFLWSHLFDARSPSAQTQIPISGRIEFDIDMRKARWYDSWITGAQRAPVDVPQSVASQPPSVSHTRGDSRTTLVTEDQSGFELEHNISAPATLSTTLRRVPRKLSLVDRYESMSALSQIGDHVDARQTIQTLGPINQEDEPQTARQDLQRRVNTWRASSSVAPTPMAATGQTSLEPANMPNTVTLDDDMAIEDVEIEIRLEDYQWSISSAGPFYDEMYSPMSSDRVLSVHLGQRNQGSVGMTPTTCTSFGPFDYDLHSPMSDVSRPPSIDLGMRMVDDAPVTPTTATSWGAPSWPASPAYSDYRPPSIDIGHRNAFSRPATPSTATSWGPASWPASPFEVSRAPSVDLGLRGQWSRPATPSTATSWGAPLSFPPSPTTPFYVQTPDAGQRAFDRDSIAPRETRAPRSLVFPYYDAWKGRPWGHVWPYAKVEDRSGQHSRSSSSTVAGYPHFDLYPAVPMHWETSSPDGLTPVVVKLEPKYPTFDLYPASYPDSLKCIYPSVRADASTSDEVSVSLPASYPAFNIYPAVYPHFDIYPAPSSMSAKVATSTTSVFYPPVQMPAQRTPKKVASSKGLARPLVVITRLQNVYPVFDLYPAVYPYNLSAIYPSVSLVRSRTPATVVVKLSSNYPFFDLYPAGYPKNLDTIYPQVPSKAVESRTSQDSIVVKLPQPGYPYFDLYPAVYPKNLETIYPQIPSRKAVESRPSQDSIVVKLAQPGYPYFDLYPAVYPKNLDAIYPQAPYNVVAERKTLQIRLSVTYPTFDLYPSVYPHLNIYPAVASSTEASQQASKTRHNLDDIAVRLQPRYPLFDLYPAVYPVFDIYHSEMIEVHERNRPIIMKLPAVYPAFDLYPAVYPSFELWPSIIGPIISSRPKPSTGSAQTPPSRVNPSNSPMRLPRKPAKTHIDLHMLVFPDGNVFTPSGTPPTRPSTQLRSRNTPDDTAHVSEPSDAVSHRVSFARDPAPLGPRARPRSGSIANARPLPVGPRPLSRMSAAANVTDTPVDKALPSHGLPSSPAQSRKSMPPPPPLSSTKPAGYVRRLSTTPEDLAPSTSALSRAKSVPMSRHAMAEKATPTHDRSKSVGAPRRVPQKRDSLVLQRVRDFSSIPSSVIHDQDRPSSRLPVLPLPNVPPVPSISKLDRSKFPFA